MAVYDGDVVDDLVTRAYFMILVKSVTTVIDKKGGTSAHDSLGK